MSTVSTFGGQVVVGSGLNLPDLVPGTTTNMLYNDGGSLYFDGSAVGGGGSYTAGSGLTLVGSEFNVFGGSGQFVGLDVDNINIQKTYTVKENILGSVSSNVTVNLASGQYVTATSTGATDWTFSGVPNGEAVGFVLELTAGGSYTQTWPSGVKWPGGTAPTLSSNVDVLTFITNDSGTTWRAVGSMIDSR